MGLSPLQSIDALAKLRPGSLLEARAKALPLGLASIDEVLPDGGLPQGAVVELSAPDGLARATRLALGACASAQREAERRAGSGARDGWCAWIDPGSSLFAPGVASAGVDLDRLLVVRPKAEAVARIAVRLATSGIFAVVVIDRCGVPGAGCARASTRWSTAVRRLGLAVEGGESTVLLLSSTRQVCAEALPVALRVELGRSSPAHLSVGIAKDRHGRIRAPQTISLRERRAAAALPGLVGGGKG